MYKVGLGFDSHRLGSDKPLVLGGVRVDSDQGLIGHSDADAPLHAITDAILGAIAAGDIGDSFPDTDPRWKDAQSRLFVKHAVSVAADKGYHVSNCDLIVLAEEPKLQPYKRQMRQSIADMLAVDIEAVSVKAKTGEGMGLVGRGEGIAAMAVVMLIKT